VTTVCNFECPSLPSGSGHAATLNPRLAKPIPCLRFVPRYRLPCGKFVCALSMPELWDIELDKDCILKRKGLINSILLLQEKIHKRDDSPVKQFAGRSMSRHMLRQHILILKIFIAYLTR